MARVLPKIEVESFSGKAGEPGKLVSRSQMMTHVPQPPQDQPYGSLDVDPLAREQLLKSFRAQRAIGEASPSARPTIAAGLGAGSGWNMGFTPLPPHQMTEMGALKQRDEGVVHNAGLNGLPMPSTVPHDPALAGSEDEGNDPVGEQARWKYWQEATGQGQQPNVMQALMQLVQQRRGGQ